jgi:ABC-2 type transport system ATP-binding protein
MRQRLGIARALVNNPQVVFLDEPTLGLDPAGQRQILANVRSIASERGAAVLLCSHLLAEVEENCSRVMILNRGHVVATGTVDEIVRQAAAPRSARFQVAGEHAERAVAALTGALGVHRVERSDGHAGWIRVDFSRTTDGRDTEPNAIVRELLDAGIELRSFELEGARLSDAFLAMTEAG